MRTTIRTIVMLTPLTLALPALAQGPSARTVSVSDLDLTRPDDMRVLNRRIAAAIEAVCPDGPRVSPLRHPDVIKCRRIAAARAKPQIAAVIARRNERLAAR